MESDPAQNSDQAFHSYGAAITSESQMNGYDVTSKEDNGEMLRGSSEPTEQKDIAAVLAPHNIINIHQHLDVIEVCLCWERNNRYSIYGKDEKQILYTYEGAQCVARQWYGSLRELTLTTTDNDDNRLLRLDRPLRCSTRMCYACCCLQEMTISIPPNNTLGRVKERWNCIIPWYEVEDSQGNLMFSLQGTACHCRLCCDIKFSVRNAAGDQVASIQKYWGGCKGIIGACNSYTIKYLDALSGQEKAVVLGATFLLDFNYFERHGKCF
ncbi:phospholipid scramblase 2 [Aplysia californica]|uniref:Phospholipid scramblase n=1 Tax=Aplysia californica TaxID=6500 RepID=A0ABM0JEC7_APLCA|nr:phospholipid scramblase 2 [Aplysia californica]